MLEYALLPFMTGERGLGWEIVSLLLGGVVWLALVGVQVPLLGALILNTPFYARSASTPRPSPTLLACRTFLIGLVGFFGLSMPLRLARLDARWSSVILLTGILVTAWRMRNHAELRATLKGLVQFYVSAETLLAFVVLTAWAAWLTYGPTDLYNSDEHFRMSIVPFVVRRFPVPDYLTLGARVSLHYYYGLEYLVGQLYGLTHLPLEIIWFRYVLPINWFLMWIGFRGMTELFGAKDLPEYAKRLLLAAFLFVLVSQPSLAAMAHMAFRQNTFAFAIGLFCVVNYLWALRSGSRWDLAVTGIGMGLTLFAKAPAGILFDVLIGADMGLQFLRSRASLKNFLTLATISMISNALFYFKFIADPYHPSLMSIGASISPMFKNFFENWFLPSKVGELFGISPEQYSSLWAVVILAWFSLAAACLTFAWIASRPWIQSDSEEASQGLGPRLLPVFWATHVFFSLFFWFKIDPSATIYWIVFGNSILLLWVSARIWGEWANHRSNWKRLALAYGLSGVILISPMVVAKTRDQAYWLGEHWNSDYLEVCRRLDQTAPENAVLLHSQLKNNLVWRLPAFCRRQSYSTKYIGATHQDPGLSFQHREEAAQFFEGKMPHPLQWLENNEICYVLWDTSGEDGHPYIDMGMEVVMKSGSLTLLRRSPQCAKNAARNP